MRQTLFHIPHELFGIPVFGIGWLLAVWIVISGVMAYRHWKRNELDGETMSFALVSLGVAAAIAFLLPQLEEVGADDAPLGVPIRGYGVFLLAGVLSGVLLAAYRAQKAGLHPDVIYSLAFWLFAFGIVGSRLFFVIQYWPQFSRPTLFQTLAEIVRFTEGGLVVYGSLIGALIAYVIFCRKEKLPALAIGDLIAPSMALGLALGRIGCLMNGCCFGGICDAGPAISFPVGSQPYLRQVHSGELLGLDWARSKQGPGATVQSVESGGVADQIGVQIGETIVMRSPAEAWKKALADPESAITVIALESSSGASWHLTLRDLPEWSKPVHPSQIYSAINGLLLCFVLLAFDRLRNRDGMTFALMLTFYPITRFLLEIIRNDEPGRFGTSLTISQWVSIGMLTLAAILWVRIFQGPPQVSKLNSARTEPATS